MADLWKLIRKDDRNQTVPVLLPASSAPNVQSDDLADIYSVSRLYEGVNASSVIDVVNKFPWTNSPESSRLDTPTIQLIEKRLLMNSVLTNLANSIFTTADSGSSFFGTGARSALQQAINAGPAGVATFLRTPPPPPENSSSTANQQGFVGKLISETAQATIGAINSVRGSEGGVKIADALENISQLYSSFQLGNPVLSPYDFLYSTEKTGFVYDLPFLSQNNFNTTSTSFGESKSGNLLAGSITNIFSELARSSTALVGTIKPGTYIEQAKQFSMGESGRTVDISFPLLNTKKFEDIALNWQLIFGLIYQNRPGRVTRSIIDMPVIYEVNCPGVVYMPFAYIRSLSIDFIGNRREVKINVPVGDQARGGSTVLTTIVPDAYQININVEGLNDETRNFLYASVTQSPVTVGGV
jgi:hypothetical protein